jgi:small subunit ribosomal protein S17
MAEEEKTEQEEQQGPEAPAEEPAAEEEAAPEAAEEPAAEEEAAPEAEAPADEAAPAEKTDAPAEPEEELTPKQRRKAERSRASGPAAPQRGPEERATERGQTRGTAAANRRRYRASRRSKRGEPGTGTVPADRAAGTRKVRLGTVVSSKADKTITVRIESARRHPVYEKVVRRSNTLHAHDEANEANEGDMVRIVETRPLSRTKRWRLLEVVERAR